MPNLTFNKFVVFKMSLFCAAFCSVAAAPSARPSPPRPRWTRTPEAGAASAWVAWEETWSSGQCRHRRRRTQRRQEEATSGEDSSHYKKPLVIIVIAFSLVLPFQGPRHLWLHDGFVFIEAAVLLLLRLLQLSQRQRAAEAQGEGQHAGHGGSKGRGNTFSSMFL